MEKQIILAILVIVLVISECYKIRQENIRNCKRIKDMFYEYSRRTDSEKNHTK